MMGQLLTFAVLFLLLSSSMIHGQTIGDDQFIWEDLAECKVGNANTLLFKKVEVDPILDEFTVKNFETLLDQTIYSLNIDETENGFLKFKLLFEIGSGFCLRSIGSKDILLSESQLVQLAEAFKTIRKVTYGRQRNTSVSSTGILYLEIEEGNMKAFRSVNFAFRP